MRVAFIASLTFAFFTLTADSQTAPNVEKLQAIQGSTTQGAAESPQFKSTQSIWDFGARYATPTAPDLKLGPADRARSLVRDGALYLSLYDALALSIENNLDVEVARFNLAIAGTETLRASGGGNLRGLDYSVTETPTGVGGPGSPLLNSAASTGTPSTPTVNDLTSFNILSPTSSNLSVQGPAGYATGPTVPTLQPTLVGQNTYFNRQNTTVLTSTTIGNPAATQPSPNTLHFVTANYAFVEGFSYGTQLQVGLNNAAQVLYGNQSRLNPFS